MSRKNKYKMKNKRVKKAFILDKCFSIAGLVFVLIALLVAGLSVLKVKKNIDNKEPYVDVIIRGGLCDNAVVTLENKEGAEPITVMEDGSERYVLIRVGDEYFVSAMSEKELKKLQDKIKDSKEKVVITGYTVYMEDENLKNKVAEQLVKLLPYDDITGARIARFVGAYYIKKISDNIVLRYLEVGRKSLILAIVLFVIGLICLITGKRLKKKSITFAAYSETNPVVLDREIADVSTQWFDSLKIYATKNYLISIGLRMYVVKYNNIQWIYNREKVVLETTLYQKIELLDKKGKRITIGKVDYGNTKNGRIRLEMQQLYDIIHKHNEETIFGYTPEVEKMMCEKNNLKYKEPKEKKK